MVEIYANIELSSEGHSIWGEGLFIWSVYRVDIRYGNEKPWSIYRRFAHFANLLEQLKAHVDPNELIPYQKILSIAEDTQPQDKIYQSTILAVPTEMGIAQRKPALNKFLEEICKDQKIIKQEIFKEFIDEPRRGIPGSVRMLTISGEEVTWTKMTNTNKPTFMVDFYPLWSIKYLLLTKKGMLYLLTTMYDPVEKAELKLDLRRPTNLIVEDLTIHMKVGVSDRLSFVMSSRDEITEWQALIAQIPKITEEPAFSGGGSPMMNNPMKSKVNVVAKPKDDVTDKYGYGL